MGQDKSHSELSAFPDRVLRLSQTLPSPAGTRIFYVLQEIFRARGKATGKVIRICFGNIEIASPLDHPAVFWRYLPAGFNQNYLLLVKHTCEARRGLIIDVGANIGDGVALLRGAGVDAPILAIEGADIWFSFLEANTNGLSDVLIEQAFLGSGEQEKTLDLHVQDGSSKLVDGKSGVQLTSLDNLLVRHKSPPIALLKTDTDGFDAKVLFGARLLLIEQRPVLFVEVDEGLLRDQGNSSQQLVDYLLECGYSWIAVWDNCGQWLGSRAISHGLSDLISRYPGGLNLPYLDIAVFSESDRHILDSLANS